MFCYNNLCLQTTYFSWSFRCIIYFCYELPSETRTSHISFCNLKKRSRCLLKRYISDLSLSLKTSISANYQAWNLFKITHILTAVGKFFKAKQMRYSETKDLCWYLFNDQVFFVIKSLIKVFEKPKLHQNLVNFNKLADVSTPNQHCEIFFYFVTFLFHRQFSNISQIFLDKCPSSVFLCRSVVWMFE